MIDPEMEWMPMDGTLLGGPFRGHDEIRGFLDTIMDAWDEFRIEPEDFTERDDQVLARCACAPMLGRAASNWTSAGHTCGRLVTGSPCGC